MPDGMKRKRIDHHNVFFFCVCRHRFLVDHSHMQIIDCVLCAWESQRVHAQTAVLYVMSSRRLPIFTLLLQQNQSAIIQCNNQLSAGFFLMFFFFAFVRFWFFYTSRFCLSPSVMCNISDCAARAFPPNTLYNNYTYCLSAIMMPLHCMCTDVTDRAQTIDHCSG